MITLLKKARGQFSSQVASYVRRGKQRPKTTLQLNSLTYDFDLKSQKSFPDFDLTHRYFLNTKTASQFHQLQCSQQTNTLSLVFKLDTLPFPSINYALQKMLNGGSTKYPIRNLIQAAKQKSFNIVSYTSTINEDYMMFNFSTPVLKDYKNLFNVYYNLLFRPLLREEDFRELVWRYSLDYETQRRLSLKGQLAEVMGENDYYEENFIYREIVRNFYNKRNATICGQQELAKLTYEDLVKFYQQTITAKNLTLINHGDMSAEYVLSIWNQLQQEKAKQTPRVFIFQQNQQQKSPQRHTAEQQLNDQQLFRLHSDQQSTLPKTINFQHMKPQTILMFSFRIQNATQQQKAHLSILSYLLFDMPQSPFMKFNSPETPYPLLYGYKSRYFNVGMTFNDLAESEEKLSESEREKLMISKEQEIFQTLQTLAKSKLPDSLIEKCLAHLQSNYYTQNGLKIIQSILQPIINNQSVNPVLQPTSIIQKLFKRYRKDNIFEKLIEKFFLKNRAYLCFRGYNNYEVVDNQQFQRQKKLNQIQKTLSSQLLKKIIAYQPPNVLQDFKVLPELQPIDLEFFEDVQPNVTKVDGVNLYYEKKLNGVKVTLKSDISDLDQELFPFLQLFCKAFPQMGTKLMKDNAYQQILSRFVNNIDLRYETQKCRSNPDQMKVFLFMTIDFNDRYFEYGFSVLNGLVKGWNHSNIFALSKIIQKCASQCFHQISQDLISFHARHLAASKSPFAFFQSPIFNSRSITGMAGDMRKVTNPKEILNGISYQLLSIHQRVFEKHRIEVMFECKQGKKDLYMKYLTMIIRQLGQSQQKGSMIQGISVENFPEQRWLKYFPNFQREIVFQCFKFPYYEKKSAAGLIFSSMVNRNIQQYNQLGGCFLYKGTMLSFIAGGRKKVLELEDFYRKINDIDQAKRAIFKRFGRYTVRNYFESGVSIEEARFFKQAIIATQKGEIQQILNEFILQPLKKGKSSILSLGPTIENYEPMLKKGWEIERPVDDLSLNVESYSTSEPVLRIEDYTKVC